jgi:FKBP-type peptidyl-prolyl cis-trans isomerase
LVNFNARLINGTLFDGTSPGLTEALTTHSILNGLNEALGMMHQGDRWQLVIPANLGFGAAGAGNGLVPPGQTLVFDITVASIVPASQAPAAGGMLFSYSSGEYGRSREQNTTLTFHP